jgi:hypothetical protein
MLENAPKYSRVLTWAACIFWIFHGSVGNLAFADTSASKSVEPATAPTESKTSDVAATKTSRLEIVFGGSLCPVCLVAFQRRLSGTAGVLDAKVESLNVERAEHSGHPPKRARAVIEFAPEKITKSELETIVRQNDFQFIKAQELPATNP